MSQPLDLCTLWHFQPDPSNEGETLGYHHAECDTQHWREVRVPIDFDTCHPALADYEGTGWFRKTLIIPKNWRGQRVILHFEGVNDHTQVWVNGVCIGEHLDGFLPFDFAVQTTIQPGAENVIAVQVDNIRRAGEVPGLQHGWRAFGGILREVTLTTTDLLHLEDVAVVAKLTDSPKPPAADQKSGSISAQVSVKNQRAEAAPVEIRVQVLDEARPIAETITDVMPLAVAAHTEMTLTVPIAEVVPWTPETPRLYTVQIALCVAGDVIDTQTRRVGFRTIAVREDKLWLNDAPIYLTGFNRHEDSPATNMCPDMTLVRHDLEAMKEAGANFVRLCHYPHHPAELDMCDELGLLVMAEIPLYFWDGHHAGAEHYAPKLAAAERQLRAMIARDQHHPAIILWSVSNETEEQRPEVVAGNAQLVRLTQQLDPTRLATHISDHWPTHPHFAEDDLISLNAYPSVSARLCQQNPQYDFADATAYWQAELAKLHALYPDKPLLITEFGYTSMAGVSGGTFGEDTHATVLECEFAGMHAPYVCGATVWCWADHAWPAHTHMNGLSNSPYGVVTRDRRKRQPFWTIRRLFRDQQGRQDPLPSEAPETESGYPLLMTRPNLDDIPHYACPAGYSIRPMRAVRRDGADEAGVWADIWRDAEANETYNIAVFHNEFGSDYAATQWRCFFIVDEQEVAVGTISAWYRRTFKGQNAGQIHWVALRRSVWGRGLGRVLLTHTLTQMAQWHTHAFLGTQSGRLAAIKLYLDFGFVPDMDEPGASIGWRAVKAQLKHPVLEALAL